MHTHPNFDLKLQYRHVLEVSTAFTLTLLIITLMLSKKFEIEAAFQAFEIPAIKMEDIPPIFHKRKAMIPVKPTIPVEDPEIEPEMDVLMSFPSFGDNIIPNPPPPPASLGSIDFYAVEVHPKIIGGTEAIVSYIVNNNLYPKVAGEAGISGKAVISFIVDKNGIPQNIEIRQERPENFWVWNCRRKGNAGDAFHSGIPTRQSCKCCDAADNFIHNTLKCVNFLKHCIHDCVSSSHLTQP